MVTGWSYLVGSSFPVSPISCTRALPREVTRRVTSPMAPLPISFTGGSVVIVARQVPARVLSWSKDFCASDFGASDWAGCLCASAWAKAIAESDNTAMESIMRSDFILNLLQSGWAAVQCYTQL